ncbi:MAG: hypothetical protein A2087_11090 [Spirochaetes bacterium GWD1_61_31]|nr:MAG: hypothetical protein A2Y37_09960 [Spirochaetes bacterium GWB1_60_80]OHD34365.1 MAG: hypothetical protein A2004_07875 [Spirochaetes bacterium GWC1_61_12]OHD43137.1 MAG: hypothetical protein A2087_11090 [Spirochaetes bacterium GWD1_61_31]OHD44274.1 MAG: hypothetical protein A2Y35_06885 [Spirochaetes bacterium GWE1_60_18]OHD60443.1 MAG: hypothetical protein A2Y32_00640 [Spirochaetes bacterium GWF1_60_12]
MADHRVGLQACPDYDDSRLDTALAELCAGLGFPDLRGKTVLLKPNILLASAPERCATTHPAVLRAVIRLVQQRGASRILVGDAPGWQPQDLAASKAGLLAATQDSGAEWSDFSQAVEVDVPAGKVVRRFQLAAPAVGADVVISLPKLKTHGLMYFTGALKNMFGLIPGLQKSAFHMRFPGRADFAVMLNDLQLARPTHFAIMDGVMAMQGHGPNNGTPCHLGLLLASPSVYALDWVAAGLIGYSSADVPYLREALEDTRYGFDPALISLQGDDIEQFRPKRFELIKVLHENDIFRSHMPAWIHRLFKNLLVPRPVFFEHKCVHCAACVKICPAKALAFVSGKQAPAVDYEACIRCYCCDEVCPADAIALKKFLYGRSRR